MSTQYFNYSTEWYRELDQKLKNTIRSEHYMRQLSDIVCSMFDFENLPFDKNFLMKTILFNGTCGIEKKGDEYILCGGNYVGVPKPDEVFPDHYIASKANYVYDHDINDSYVVAYMNPDRLPDNNIVWYAEEFTEIDKSLKCNIMYSRLLPVALVGREKTKVVFEETVKNLFEGELINSIYAPLDPVKSDPGDIVKTIDITSPTNVDKIQYLSRYREDLLRRFMMDLGHSMATTSKSANLLLDEVHSTETYSVILPFMYRHCIEDWVDEMNTKFGLDVQVSFSRAWYELELIYTGATAEQAEEVMAEVQNEGQEQDDNKEVVEDEKPDTNNETATS